MLAVAYRSPQKNRGKKKQRRMRRSEVGLRHLAFPFMHCAHGFDANPFRTRTRSDDKIPSECYDKIQEVLLKP